MEKSVMVRKNMAEQVVAERALAVAKSPFVIKLLYLQSKERICKFTSFLFFCLV